jgi:hypothetical protein
MPGASSAPSSLAHYAAGKLTKVALPVAAQDINVESVAPVPGTGRAPSAPASAGTVQACQWSSSPRYIRCPIRGRP